MRVFASFAKKLTLLPALGSLSLLVACGGGGPAPKPVGSFSNASLNGQYTFRLTGVFYSSTGTAVPYTEAGFFTADGNGNITGGTDDFVQGGAALVSTSIVATSSGAISSGYSINPDGTGSIALLINGTTIPETLAVTLSSSSKLYLIEQDLANSYGVAELQSASTVSSTTAPTGTFAFRFHDQGLSVRAGAMTISGGNITGSQDVLVGGVLDNNTGLPLTIAGTMSAPSGGRGTGSFNDGLSTVSFVYYVVDGNNLRFLRTDSGLNSLGRAEMQSGTFTNASMTGGFAFGARGDDSSSVSGVNTVGVLLADGAGSITGGEFDAVRDGTSQGAGVAINSGGTYSVGSNGCVVVNYTTNLGASVQQIFWLVNSSRAFFITNDATKNEDGIADLQQSTSFSNSNLTGQYAFVMDGFISGTANLDRVGWINADGAGNMSLFEGVNNSSANPNFALPGTLTGTYSFATGNDTTLGRATATISNLSAVNNDLVFYVVSSSRAYILQNAPGYNLLGAMDLQ